MWARALSEHLEEVFRLGVGIRGGCGLIKALGICLATIFQGMLVAFSWWGVNLLGIGLHSYGFTSGIFNALMTFYAFEGAVLLLGFYVALKDRMPDAPTRAAPPPQAEGSISS